MIITWGHDFFAHAPITGRVRENGEEKGEGRIYRAGVAST